MANIKSQIKRNRQNEVRHERNKSVRSALKTASKRVRTALAESDPASAQEQVLAAARAYDKAASKGVLPKRAAARHKSRLARAANAAVASQAADSSE